MGNDLKMEGITQNQKVVDFNMEDKLLAEILTGIVRKANPDPTVKEASEPGQKLIWVVGPNPDDKSKQAIIVTTRAAAERESYKLPAPFQLKQRAAVKGPTSNKGTHRGTVFHFVHHLPCAASSHKRSGDRTDSGAPEMR